MEEFVDQTKTLVGALGWDLFREMRGRLTEPSEQMQPATVDPSPIFFFRGEGFSAEMTIAQSGDFVVKAGSRHAHALRRPYRRALSHCVTHYRNQAFFKRMPDHWS